MSDSVFFWHALVLHVLCISLAITLHSIDIIFDFVGAVCCAFSIFLFPGVGYIFAKRAYGNLRAEKSKFGDGLYLFLAWLFVILGFALISAAIYLNWLRWSGKLPKQVEV